MPSASEMIAAVDARLQLIRSNDERAEREVERERERAERQAERERDRIERDAEREAERERGERAAQAAAAEAQLSVLGEKVSALGGEIFVRQLSRASTS